MAILHDAYRIIGTPQNVAYNATGGGSVASAALGPQTYWVLLSVPGLYAAGSGVRIVIGDGTPTATATSTLVPVNFPMVFACTPGQKVAVVGNDAATGNLSVTELS